MSAPGWLQRLFGKQADHTPAQVQGLSEPAPISQRQALLDQIFAFNQHLLQVLSMLEPHREDPTAAAEIRRLAGYRYVLIEFAALASSVEESAERSIFQRAERWIDGVLLEARRNNVDADTFEGYLQLKRNLERRVVEPPGLRMG